MKRYETLNSTYEVEDDGTRIRRVSGLAGTAWPVENGEWIDVESVTEVRGGPVAPIVLAVVVSRADDEGFVTSAVVAITDPEAVPEEVEPPEPCSYEVRAQTWEEPAEFCEADAMPGSEFCHAHDPDAIQDFWDARAEAQREEARYGE